MRLEVLLDVLARSFLAGEPEIEAIVSRAGATLGRPWGWLRPAAERYVQVAGGTRPRRRDVVRLLREDPGFRRAWARRPNAFRIAQWIAETPRMQPVPAAAEWRVPPIESPGDLARWLQIEVSDLDWFADLKGLAHKSAGSRLSHYRYEVLRKPGGGVRLVEAPKQRLKHIQRQILARILDPIPPHPSAHGFVKGRSIRSFAAPHAGRRVLLRMDLRDFFPSFAAARIQTFFRIAGYPEPVADLLGGLCTTVAPRSVWREIGPGFDPSDLLDARTLYERAHLPQGAPTSPALANLCSYRADC